MTPTTPQNMTDDQLNDAVAREVMGWEYTKRDGGYGHGILSEGTKCWPASIFSPANNNDDELRVCEKMGGMGFDVEMSKGACDMVWQVRFTRHSRGVSVIESEECRARAVCIAALQAVRATRGI